MPQLPRNALELAGMMSHRDAVVMAMIENIRSVGNAATPVAVASCISGATAVEAARVLNRLDHIGALRRDEAKEYGVTFAGAAALKMMDENWEGHPDEDRRRALEVLETEG